MLSDNYCIALLVLVLFFIYVDSVNNVEGYASLDEAYLLPSGEKVKAEPVVPEGLPKEVVQDYVGVGLKPQKVDGMKPTSSMKNDFMAVTSQPDNLASLDQAFSMLSPQAVPTQVPADLDSLGSRVGGVGNMGDASLGGAGGPVPSGSTMPDSQLTGAPQDRAKGGSTKPSKKVELHMAYAPWCGWSKKALPDFDKVMGEFNGKQVDDKSVSVMKHDSETDEGKTFAKENKVRGFPTIFFLVDGNRVDAKGRSYDDLVKQLKSL